MTFLAVLGWATAAVTLFLLVVTLIGSADICAEERRRTDTAEANARAERAARRVAQAALRAHNRANHTETTPIFTQLIRDDTAALDSIARWDTGRDLGAIEEWANGEGR